ncbi:hypothetical protein [Streptomyces olivochromogenes]|uniref:hypothetical protein n=1 Tax=Streptomyces olivochromogenes TaxID=1963 RepID=UPI001F1D32CA|nr:hypothetical protein [Streptomyces olivochromogenes]MCF3136841.1 hypothetical protein [Streptomyces olivochromogenes]
MADVSWADKLSAVSAGLSVVTAVIALWIARTANKAAYYANQAAAQANATAESVAHVERGRWHHEMTPQFDVTITRFGPGSNQASLMLTFEGPAALERLDAVEIEIRDDGYTHGVGLAGEPDEQQLAETIWGPYRFVPGIDNATTDGRSTPAVPLELGEWLKRALQDSMPPAWTDRAAWREQYAGAPVRLWVRCRREGHRPWTLTYNVPVTDVTGQAPASGPTT